MADWNVVATARDKGFVLACDILQGFGRVRRTEFYNVLLVAVDDRVAFLEAFRELTARDTSVLGFALSRVVPVAATFSFSSATAFEAKARGIVLAWAPRLAGKTFHVRLHRRGFKGRLATPEEERFLDDVLLEATAAAGAPASIAFDDADAVIVVETVGTWAGLSLWTRDDLVRYPFIRAD